MTTNSSLWSELTVSVSVVTICNGLYMIAYVYREGIEGEIGIVL